MGVVSEADREPCDIEGGQLHSGLPIRVRFLKFDRRDRSGNEHGANGKFSPTPPSRFRPELVFPEAVEPTCCQIRVAGGMGDAPMAQVVLDRAGFVAVIRQLKSAGMAQHVRMHRKPKIR